MKKGMRISYKLGLAIMFIVLTVLFPLGFIIDRSFTNFYISTKQSELQDYGDKLAKTLSQSQGKKSIEETKMLLSFTSYQAIVLNSNHRVTMNTGNLTFDLSTGDWNHLAHDKKISKQWTSPQKENYYLVGIPITNHNQLTGVVLLFSPMKALLTTVHTIRSSLLMAGVGAILLALGFTNLLSKWLSKPLIEIETATKQISEGNLKVRLKPKSGDELGSLSESINHMALSLEQIQNQRSEFFSNIAHELKTPITYISGYADVLKKGLTHSKKEEQQYLSIIYDESERLSTVVNDLFNIAILEEGKIRLSMEIVEINAFLKPICQSMEYRVSEKGIVLNLVLSEEPLWIQADPFRMNQVIMNLLTNALRYTDEGEIIVRTFSSNKMNYIEIEDTGIGMREEELNQVFERFYRSDKSRSRKTGGTGLGLAIVKELVDQQNGQIHVKSKLGKGTCFQLVLPQVKGRKSH